MRMTVKEVAQACGGEILCGQENDQITSVDTDSRKILPGGLFVPIRGDKVDAHRFIHDVLEKGAKAVLTQEHLHAEGPGAWIRVEHTRAALQQIAAA